MSRTGTRAGAALAIVFGLAAGTARAEERPFALKGTATWDYVGNAFTEVGANFDGVAQVTHLGKVGQGGTLYLDLGSATAAGIPGGGKVILTAANGDTLTFDYEGLLDPNTGLGTGTLTFTGGTGRFTDATGTGTFAAHLDFSNGFVGAPMAVTIEGTIDY